MVAGPRGIPVETRPARLEGLGASAGRVSGVARVVYRIEEAADILPGQILVCPTLSLEWVPLFREVAGVVTDAGGILARGARVAREYRIPAVVGVDIATEAIRDGQQITVDGNEGIVDLHDSQQRGETK